MVTKKKRRRRLPTTVKKSKALVLSGVFFVCCVFLVGLVLVVTNSSHPPISLPYEEIATLEPWFTTNIDQIDTALSDAFFEARIEQKNILFSVVDSMHRNGKTWDYSELIVRCTDQSTKVKLDGILRSRLTRLLPDITFHEKIRSNTETVYTIVTHNQITHKIIVFTGKNTVFSEQEKTLKRPKIAIIIDDLGYQHTMAMQFMECDLPLTLSILPHAPYTETLAREAMRRGREILLHLPMEPKNYPRIDPGPGTIVLDMEDYEIRDIIGESIKQVPGLRGVNNHMGSLFTENSEKMSVVLDEIKKRGLYWVDSRTTSQSVSFDVAKRMGVPVVQKNIFLDNERSSKALKFQLDRLTGIARFTGKAVGIGHPHKKTLELLLKSRNQLYKAFDVVPVSELVG